MANDLKNIETPELLELFIAKVRRAPIPAPTMCSLSLEDLGDNKNNPSLKLSEVKEMDEMYAELKKRGGYARC